MRHILFWACQSKTFPEKFLPLRFWPKQFTELRQVPKFLSIQLFFSELTIPQKAFPPLLMESTIFFFDVANNKRRLSENKTLLYHYTSSSTPDHFFMLGTGSSGFQRPKGSPQRGNYLPTATRSQWQGKRDLLHCNTLLEPQDTLERKRFISTVSWFAIEVPPQGLVRNNH